MKKFKIVLLIIAIILVVAGIGFVSYGFYKKFPNIFHTVWGKSESLLSWSHYRILIQVENQAARDWYAAEAAKQTWSVRTLQRNVLSQYYILNFPSKNLQTKPV